MDNIQCFIFDLDNTLVFNKRANYAAYRSAFADVDLKFTENDFEHYFEEGDSIDTIYENYTKTHKSQYSPEILQRIKQRKTATYPSFFHLSELNNTTAGLLRALAPHYFTALATTANEENARALLAYFELDQLFKYMIFGGDVGHKKPDPECFYKIAKHFDVTPEQCLIFEDSKNGFIAAEAFGAHICKVVK